MNRFTHLKSSIPTMLALCQNKFGKPNTDHSFVHPLKRSPASYYPPVSYPIPKSNYLSHPSSTGTISIHDHDCANYVSDGLDIQTQIGCCKQRFTPTNPNHSWHAYSISTWMLALSCNVLVEKCTTHTTTLMTLSNASCFTWKRT